MRRAATPTPTDARSDLLVRATLMVLCVGTLCRALELSGGMLGPDTPASAIRWLLASFAVAVAAVFARLPGVTREAGLALFSAASGVTLVANYAQIAANWPGVYLRITALERDYFPFLGGVGAAAVLSGVTLASTGWMRRTAFWSLLAAHFLLGAWLIHASPMPHIDVHEFQTQSAKTLLEGRDPYATTLPDIYDSESTFYGPGVASGGEVHTGYPYMPVTLLVACASVTLAGDVRFGGLVALLIAAWCIAAMRWSTPNVVAAILLLSVPRALSILESSYTEPVVVAVLAATLWCAVRYPRALPWALGGLIASKQYMLAAAIPAAPMLVAMAGKSPAPRWRAVWKVLIAAAVVTLPLMLWNVPGFWHSVVGFHLRQPYRPDGFGILPWIGRLDATWAPPGWLQFVALGVTLAIAAWRLPRTPLGFALTIFVAYFAFFLFSTQAFGNYYFFVLGCACCAIGMIGASLGPETENRRRVEPAS